MTLIAGTLFVMEVSGNAVPVDGRSPAAHLEASPARAAIAVTGAPAEDVGTWVVEGSDAASVATDPAATSVGQKPIRTARVVVQGKDHDVVTNAGRVGQLLSAMGIELDQNDRVSPPPRTPLRDGAKIRVFDVTCQNRKSTHEVAFGTETRTTTELSPGEREVTRAGKVGLERWTVRRCYADGEPTTHHVTHREVLREPVSSIVSVGAEASSSSGGGSSRTQSGTASWYNHPGLTAAHPTLPFGTRVTVTNLANGESVEVMINDRGPFIAGRIIDLSDEAFAQIAPLGAGLIQVRISW